MSSKKKYKETIEQLKRMFSHDKNTTLQISELESYVSAIRSERSSTKERLERLNAVVDSQQKVITEKQAELQLLKSKLDAEINKRRTAESQRKAAQSELSEFLKEFDEDHQPTDVFTAKTHMDLAKCVNFLVRKLKQCPQTSSPAGQLVFFVEDILRDHTDASYALLGRFAYAFAVMNSRSNCAIQFTTKITNEKVVMPSTLNKFRRFIAPIKTREFLLEAIDL